jgi:antitoxin component YwqK of YwqJK toxin-antitoxin module
MKFFLTFSLFFVSVCLVKSQNVKRHVKFSTIDKDSVSLPLNDEYYLIEDSCAQIIRNSRFNFGTRKFYGKFTDVSKASPALIVAEGTYTTDGLKNGLFITHYLNGNLQAKGDFKNDKYDGKWEMYYDDGKPELTFEVINGECHIIDAWKQGGGKIIDNGNGAYIVNLGLLYWKGKLLNGKPDGTWKLLKTDDINSDAMATEHFKKGVFHDGSNGMGDYKDVSRIDLVNPFKLNFINAEKMYVSQVPCNGVKPKHIVNAQYRDGLNVFSGYISGAVSPYLGSTDLKGIDNTIEINGEISEKGNLINLKNNDSFREDIARGIILRLKNLPPLQPATVDGVPVKQKFTISFKINNSVYQFSYRFLPVQVN